MSASASIAGRRPARLVLRFICIGTALCLAPFLALGLVALSYLGLNRDAAILRQEMFAGTGQGWLAKVQVNVGESTLGALDLGLSFVQDLKLAPVREAIATCKRASVGVYERKTSLGMWSRPELFARADRAMEKRGWKRLVGVADQKSTVLIYGPGQGEKTGSVDVCVAVINDQNLVVASARLDADALDELVQRNGFGRLKGHRFSLAQN